MTKQIDRIKKTRLFLIDLINDLTIDQLNEVPAGFNNNIAWNLGHLVAAQQGVCYVRSGLKPAIDESNFSAYRSGTKPEQYIDNKEVETIKNLLVSSLELFETDYNNNLFDAYKAWSTRYGVELSNIDDAIQFLAYHEGLHSGYIMALKRLVKK